MVCLMLWLRLVIDVSMRCIMNGVMMIMCVSMSYVNELVVLISVKKCSSVMLSMRLGIMSGDSSSLFRNVWFGNVVWLIVRLVGSLIVSDSVVDVNVSFMLLKNVVMKFG